MELFLVMLPMYIIGNLHCAGMCGPLVFILGKNPMRYWYFLGRLFSFTLAGMLAGEIGALITLPLKEFHIAALLSIFFGLGFMMYGLKESLFRKVSIRFLPSKADQWLKNKIVSLSLKTNARSVFLYGALTILLPCGQSAIVFAACALSGSAIVGLFNGFAFALITSPALIMVLGAHKVMKKFKQVYQPLFGCSVIFVGLLSLLRGVADLGYIEHLAINESWHLILY